MKKWLVLLALAIPGAAHAVAPIQEGANFGLGVGGGMGTTGLSLKYFIGADFALQGVIGGWNLLGMQPVTWRIPTANSDSNKVPAYAFNRPTSGFGFNVDALFESQPWVNGSAVDLAFNGGVGLNVLPTSFNDDWLGMSLVGGFEIDLEVIPIDIVIEYRPNLWLLSGLSDGGYTVGENLDWLAFVAHIRVYPFPAGPK